MAVIASGGYLGIVALMALESACLPLPSEIIMPFAGYLVSTGRFNLWLVATAGAIGCNVGSSVAYAAGYYGGRRMIDRWGRYLLFGRRELDRVESFFDRFGSITVFVSRLMPGVRTFIALPAGIARMPQLRFQIYTFVGSWPWCLGLAYIGMKLGERWNQDPRLRDFMHRFEGVILLVAVLSLAAYVWWRLREQAAGRD